MQQPIIDILYFSKNPKLKIGEKIREIIADNGFHKYSKDVFVAKIEKIKNSFKVYITEYK